LQNDIDKGVDDDEAIEEWAAADIDGNGRESLSLSLVIVSLSSSAPNGPSPNTFHAAGLAAVHFCPWRGSFFCGPRCRRLHMWHVGLRPGLRAQSVERWATRHFKLKNFSLIKFYAPLAEEWRAPL